MNPGDPVKVANEAGAAIPDAHVEIIKGAGHMVIMEGADAFNAAVLRWL